MSRLKPDGKRTYVLVPAGWDAFDDRVRPHAGAVVRKVQPFGCPRNGTMGHCYVERVDDETFIGLVLLNSLQRTT